MGHITKYMDIVRDILQKIRILGGTYYKRSGYRVRHITKDKDIRRPKKDKDIGRDILQKIRIFGDELLQKIRILGRQPISNTCT